MGRFFLFREVRPRGDVPYNLEFWRGKGLKVKVNLPLHRSPPK
jgi:hypothetical protein